jgi:PleD family two-component response regulator
VAPDAGSRLAERVLDLVRAAEWGAVAPGLEVRVSAGVVAGADPADLLVSLSDALHAAKSAGRDQVVVAAPVPA